MPPFEFVVLVLELLDFGLSGVSLVLPCFRRFVKLVLEPEVVALDVLHVLFGLTLISLHVIHG